MSESNLILLFTAIPPSRPYYLRDLLNTICYPIDSKIQFSYRKNLIPHELLYGEELDNKRALIVYCEFLGKQIDNQYYKYHPIRFGKITESKKQDGSLSLVITLEEYPDFKNSYDAINNFQSLILSSDEQPTPINPHHLTTRPKFVRMEKSNIRITSQHSFENAVSYIKKLGGLKKKTFFSIDDCKYNNSSNLKLFDAIGSRDQKKSLEYRNGQSYLINIYTRFGDLPEILLPKLQISFQSNVISGPIIRQIKEGYEIIYSIYFPRSFDTHNGMINLKVIGDDKNNEIILSPEFTFFVKTKPSYLLISFTIILLLIGIVLISINPETIKSIGSTLDPNIFPYDPRYYESNWIKYSGIITLGAKLLGSAFVGIGSYVGFRKLPIFG